MYTETAKIAATVYTRVRCYAVRIHCRGLLYAYLIGRYITLYTYILIYSLY